MLFVYSSRNKTQAPVNDCPGPTLRFQPPPGCEVGARGFASFAKPPHPFHLLQPLFPPLPDAGLRARGQVVHPRFSRESSGKRHRVAERMLGGDAATDAARAGGFPLKTSPHPSRCRPGNEDRRGDFLRGVVIDHTMSDTGLTNKTIRIN